jgi:hypothetical protein
VKVPLQEVQDHSYAVWNAMIDLLSKNPRSELSVMQQNAQLALMYESLVHNGGHEHFLDTQNLTDLEEYPQALQEIGALEHAAILKTAIALFRNFRDHAEFEAYDDMFAKLDADREKCLTAVLNRLLYDNLEVFIETV